MCVRLCVLQRYGPAMGYPPLVAALRARLQAECGVASCPQEHDVMVTQGANQVKRAQYCASRLPLSFSLSHTASPAARLSFPPFVSLFYNTNARASVRWTAQQAYTNAVLTLLDGQKSEAAVLFAP